jgi:thiol-disulfide isomerase/thioredoxin
VTGAGAAAVLTTAGRSARADGGASPAPEPRRKPGPPLSALQVARKHVHGIDARIRLPDDRPIDWGLPVLDGTRFQLAALRGKVVVLNVFATWCPPCRGEQPAIVDFAAAHDDTVVVGVIYCEEDNVVRRYREKYGIRYTIGMDRAERYVQGLYTRAQPNFPTTVVVRPDGTVSCAWVDDCDRDWLENERLTALA